MLHCNLPEEGSKPFFVQGFLVLNFLCVTLMLCLSNPTFAQQSVSGTVSSNDSALVGVSVKVKGENKATQTNASGRYMITVGPNARLVFSMIGYLTQEISVRDSKIINVQLTVESKALEQVVVIGYGTSKKATVTGAIATVKGAELVKSPAMNLSNSMAGRLAGVTAVTRSGEPGNDGSLLRIRGSNTLNDNSPLIVVDGIAGRVLERIDPADIESVSVLKDASAAIYGARAANGVILITTKRGAGGTPKITVSLNQGFASPSVVPKMADAATYAQMVNEIKVYRNQNAVYTDEDIQKYRDGSDPWGHPNTNWFDATYKPYSAQRYGNATLSGGTDAMRYLVSVGYRYQDAIYRNSATNYSQANFRTNLDGKISKNIRLSFDVAGRQENRNYPTRSADNIFSSAIRGKPNVAAYWPNGLPGPDIERGENPVVLVTDQTGYDKDINYILESNAKLDITIPWITGLSFTTNASIDKNIKNHKLWQTPWFLYYWDGTSYGPDNTPSLTKTARGYASPQLSQDMADGKRTTLNALLNYATVIGENHRIKGLAGIERIKGASMNFLTSRRYFISSAADQLFAGGDQDIANSGSASINARLNYFGRLNYSFKERYLAEFVFRYDGSYIFPVGKQFGFFPGISLGYRISEEAFWKNDLSFINNFKLRTSWGKTGNDLINPYQYIQSYGFGRNAVFNGTTENKSLQELRIPNPFVTWEVANQSNVGFDAQLLDGHLSFSADYFHNLRTNILSFRNASVPATTGLTLPRQNIGEVLNRGYEFELGYRNQTGNFSYNVSVNGGYQKNKIQFWDETPGAPVYQKSTGHPMNTSLYYEAIGIFKDEAAVAAYPHWDNARPGDIIFKDVNGDNAINGLDRVRSDKNDIPTFSGGLNLDLAYKNFYATALLQGALGAVRTQWTFSGESGNFLAEDANGRWTPENPDAEKPRTWNFTDEYWVGNYGASNTYFMRNNNYMRLKTLEVGYNIPGSLINKAGINNVRVYLSGLNIFTIDKLENFDPETSGNNPYPSNKVYNLGLSVTF